MIYRGHPDYAGEVDHGELLSRLEGYDGWALSCSAASLPAICALAVARSLSVRVAVWARGSRPHATARVLNGWEPVVYAGGRRFRLESANLEATGSGLPASEAGTQVTRRPVRAVTDVLVGVVPRRRATHPGWLVGSKPPAFCEWVFDLLGAGQPGDVLDDLFAGSGIVARSWALRMGRDPSRVDRGHQ